MKLINHGTERGYALERARNHPHCEPCRIAHNEYKRYLRNGYRRVIFAHYGWACVCCGSLFDLTVDHVNGDGNGEAGETLYLHLIREHFPPGFQTMCRPCNSSKGQFGRCALHNLTEIELGGRVIMYLHRENVHHKIPKQLSLQSPNSPPRIPVRTVIRHPFDSVALTSQNTPFETAP